MSKKNSSSKKAANARANVRRNAGQNGSRNVSQNGNSQVAADPQGRRRRYHRRATVLHAFTFITCFTLFIFFSFRIANQPLIEMQPIGAEGWIQVTDPATGASEKKEFSVSQGAACELAQLIDSTESTFTTEKLQKYGEIRFAFMRSRNVRTYFISQNGIRDSKGLKRHKEIAFETVKQIVLEEKAEK
ncbi:MAG: hypothetical protein IJD43_12645 [Thermoguttaceae bacterium]|nr:hypothetical protein [Planctomycetaceae bacterium]MBQ4144309.1 hypothetical protein [Thermoguttaceae bacterium]